MARPDAEAQLLQSGMLAASTPVRNARGLDSRTAHLRGGHQNSQESHARFSRALRESTTLCMTLYKRVSHGHGLALRDGDGVDGGLCQPPVRLRLSGEHKCKRTGVGECLHGPALSPADLSHEMASATRQQLQCHLCGDRVTQSSRRRSYRGGGGMLAAARSRQNTQARGWIGCEGAAPARIRHDMHEKCASARWESQCGRCAARSANMRARGTRQPLTPRPIFVLPCPRGR